MTTVVKFEQESRSTNAVLNANREISTAGQSQVSWVTHRRTAPVFDARFSRSAQSSLITKMPELIPLTSNRKRKPTQDENQTDPRVPAKFTVNKTEDINANQESSTAAKSQGSK